MKFLDNLTVKKKLVLILFFPILGLLIFSSLQSYEYYEKYNSMKRIETLILLSTKISKLVHETQKERGMTAGYLGSKGVKFKSKLPSQRLLSDERFDEMKRYCKKIDFSAYPAIFKDNVDKMSAKYEGLNKIRPKVNSLSISGGEAISYYTKMNALILDNVITVSKLSSDAKISRATTAYANFLLSKERAGIERAVGANTLGRDSFGEGMKVKLNNLINTQNVYMNNFLKYANEDAIEFYNKTLVGKEINEVNRIRKILLDSSKKYLIVSQMKDLVGYGGIIHNFKNYVIRGASKYEVKITNQYKELVSLIEKYNAIGNISGEEKKLLNDIQVVFTKYYKGLEKVTTAINSNTGVKQLDKVVKVSDGPAIKALGKLSNSLFADSAEYWFSQITGKINKLKTVDNHLATSLIADVQAIANSTYNSLITTLSFSILSIFVAMIFGYIVSNRLVNALTLFQTGLEDFFKFLNYEIKDVQLLKNSSNDEFGKMALNVNANITKTKENVLQDRKLIDETIEVSNQINKGYLDGKIINSSPNPALNELKDILNSTIDGLNGNLLNIQKVLNSYTKLDYLPVVEKNGMEGVIKQLIDGINELGETITDTLVINKRNGLILETSANTLLNNVDKLNTSSNEAAASLEETAAALEEITSTIINNSDNVTSMAKYATKVTESADKGEKLASDTMSAMDNINEQVTAINDAITVIDQIAFQTNILSLNAAVEAATAGEAGKGFAVVAQEVRNLASRSADAAKEIKELVETATVKANAGKNISKNMLNEYKELNQDIEKTLDLITQVDAASKEQQAGIEQINGAVTELDQQTQMNAAASLETQEIAIGTQKLSEAIVSEADKKEFRGKDEVTDRRDNLKDMSYDEKECQRKVEKEIRVLPSQKRRDTIMVANEEEYVTTSMPVKKVVNSADEAWESF